VRLSDADICRLAAQLAPFEGPAAAPEGWLEKVTHRRVIVHTKADKSFEGTLVLAAPDGVVLWSTELLVDSKPVKLGGEVFIPADQVLFVQTVRM
jgi:hypothetical protein